MAVGKITVEDLVYGIIFFIAYSYIPTIQIRLAVHPGEVRVRRICEYREDETSERQLTSRTVCGRIFHALNMGVGGAVVNIQ